VTTHGRAARATSGPAPTLQRAALLQAMAHAFAYPEAGHKGRVQARLRRLRPAGERVADRSLRRAIAGARHAWASVSEDALRAHYGALFLGSGPCPLRETAYGDGRRIAGRTAELSDIGGFYAAFGVRPSAVEPDLPDHLCSELEFCSMLLLKLAHAQARGSASKRRVVARALRAFMHDHLGRWPDAFARELARAAGESPYRPLAAAVALATRIEARRCGARPRPMAGRPADDPMQEEGLNCPRQSGHRPEKPGR